MILFVQGKAHSNLDRPPASVRFSLLLFAGVPWQGGLNGRHGWMGLVTLLLAFPARFISPPLKS